MKPFSSHRRLSIYAVRRGSDIASNEAPPPLPHSSPIIDILVKAAMKRSQQNIASLHSFINQVPSVSMVFEEIAKNYGDSMVNELLRNVFYE